MRFIARLLALFGGGLLLAAAVGAIAARSIKQQIVPVDTPEADEVKLAAIFDPIAFRSTASSFRGGSIDCWFGGGIFDLRGAKLDPQGATLQVRAIFGGGQIVVPDTWRVTSRITGIGGLGDSRKPGDRQDDAPHLIIEGRAMFGGFGVTSDVPEAEVRGLNEAIARRRRHAPTPPVDAEAPASSAA